MTGFLFGLGLTVAAAQATKLLGVEDGGGDFVPALGTCSASSATCTRDARGRRGLVALVALRRLAPVPGTLVVLVWRIVVSALFDLAAHGVDVVGNFPTALPDPALPAIERRRLGRPVPGRARRPDR